MMWVLFSDPKHVAVYRPAQRVQIFGEDDTLDLDDLLPDFTIAVKYIFK